jgi:hypothetical protein
MSTLTPLIHNVRDRVECLGQQLQFVCQENASNVQRLCALDQRVESCETGFETLQGCMISEIGQLKSAVSGLGDVGTLLDVSLPSRLSNVETQLGTVVTAVQHSEHTGQWAIDQGHTLAKSVENMTMRVARMEVSHSQNLSDHAGDLGAISAQIQHLGMRMADCETRVVSIRDQNWSELPMFQSLHADSELHNKRIHELGFDVENLRVGLLSHIEDCMGRVPASGEDPHFPAGLASEFEARLCSVENAVVGWDHEIRSLAPQLDENVQSAVSGLQAQFDAFRGLCNANSQSLAREMSAQMAVWGGRVQNLEVSNQTLLHQLQVVTGQLSETTNLLNSLKKVGFTGFLCWNAES